MFFQEFARAQMEQIQNKSNVSLKTQEPVPDRNRKSAAPTRLTSPAPIAAESSRQQQLVQQDDQGKQVQHLI